MGKIYFDESLVAKALEIAKDAYDMRDLYNDLCKIGYYLNMKNYTIESLEEARQLDKQLYEKYSTIGLMLSVVNSVNNQIGILGPRTSDTIDIFERLKQDYFGIIAHVLIKKQCVKEWKEYIKEIKN